MISSKILLKQKKISHGFFNRIGGKSIGIYNSLNCGPGSNDKKKNIKLNLKIVKNKIRKKSKKIFLLYKTKSNKTIFLSTCIVIPPYTFIQVTTYYSDQRLRLLNS